MSLSVVMTSVYRCGQICHRKGFYNLLFINFHKPKLIGLFNGCKKLRVYFNLLTVTQACTNWSMIACLRYRNLELLQTPRNLLMICWLYL